MCTTILREIRFRVRLLIMKKLKPSFFLQKIAYAYSCIIFHSSYKQVQVPTYYNYSCFFSHNHKQVNRATKIIVPQLLPHPRCKRYTFYVYFAYSYIINCKDSSEQNTFNRKKFIIQFLDFFFIFQEDKMCYR